MLRRLDNVGIVVDELEGRMPVDGGWVDRVGQLRAGERAGELIGDAARYGTVI